MILNECDRSFEMILNRSIYLNLDNIRKTIEFFENQSKIDNVNLIVVQIFT